MPHTVFTPIPFEITAEEEPTIEEYIEALFSKRKKVPHELSNDLDDSLSRKLLRKDPLDPAVFTITKKAIRETPLYKRSSSRIDHAISLGWHQTEDRLVPITYSGASEDVPVELFEVQLEIERSS